MKTLNHIILVISITLLFSCNKEKIDQEATIVRDCTGTYLRIDTKDYLVCNFEVTNGFSENDRVTASFKKIEYCEALDIITCELYHKNYGLINVTEIN
ncbi:MAG: hypothetical protein ABF242_03450 [Flavobacteriales bacterium]